MKKMITYCYYATINGKYMSDEYATRQEVAEEMRDRGYASWEYEMLCLCEEWDAKGEALLRQGSGTTQRDARQNLR